MVGSHAGARDARVLVVILVFFLVQTGFLKRKRGGKKMTGVLVRTSSA